MSSPVSGFHFAAMSRNAELAKASGEGTVRKNTGTQAFQQQKKWSGFGTALFR
jgi:hypothetical protein